MGNKKNVWVVPANKPGHLWYEEDGTLTYNNYAKRTRAVDIYITSDEEPQYDDFGLIDGILSNTGFLKSKDLLRPLTDGGILGVCESEYSELLLTTNPNLIERGAQAIDADFLRWYVANPCDWVTVVKLPSKGSAKPRCVIAWEGRFKAVVRTEKPKMNGCYFTPGDKTSSATICANCGEEKTLRIIGEGIKLSTHNINPKPEEPKQETLKEAASKYLNSTALSNNYAAFIAGAEWQVERMPSEEAFRNVFETGRKFQLIVENAIKELTDQFKKIQS